MASFGHPLTLMVFTSTAFAVSLFEAVHTHLRRYWLASVCAAIAVLLTVSRTGVIAVAVCVCAGLMVLLTSRQQGMRRRAALALVGGAAVLTVLVHSPIFVDRNLSDDGISSSLYRSRIWSGALSLVRENPLFGVGPGASAQVFTESTGLLLENSALQLLAGVGIPATALIVLLVPIVIFRGISARRASSVAGLTAYLVAISGFNALDSNPAILVLAALLIMGCLAPRSELNDDSHTTYLDFNDLRKPAYFVA